MPTSLEPLTDILENLKDGQHSVYVLRLQNNKYYVGYAKDVAIRICEHILGHGAYWTKIHKPLELVFSRAYSSKYEAMNAETEATLILARNGKDVRGAGWTCKTPPPAITMEELEERRKQHAIVGESIRKLAASEGGWKYKPKDKLNENCTRKSEGLVQFTS